ncbi:MAG TPA: adenylate/guanylate cyclase domain-containing protein [Thermoanaerobaculia bacterium]|nr:adenylate/guanylate cyclase domain-containing protein [Thermoanaerobaculia bacterium]
MPWKLVAIDGQRSVPIGGRPLIVGRSVGCDLSIQDPTVSRQHAEVEVAPGGAGLRVRDLASTNGTFLNGERIWDTVAPPGARVSFGKVLFEVQEEEPTAIVTPGLGQDLPLDATILRQVPVRGTADIAARLSEVPQGTSRLRIVGESLADRQDMKLGLLIDIAKELSGQPDVDRLLEQIVDLTFQVMSVDRVAILLASDQGELVPRISRRRIDHTTSTGGIGDTGEIAMLSGRGGEDWRVPSAIARKAVQERVAVLLENVPVDLAGDGTILHHRVQSALCAPLLGSHGSLLGLIYLDNLGATHSFSEEDLEFLTAFSGMAAVSLENSRLVERARREAVVLSNFQRYFAPDLAQQIAGQEEAVQLGGSKRRVTVLFSDIRGFTSLSEAMSPDEIASLLTEYFTVMVEIVFEHGGTLDKFIGDALMALWGAPLSRDDDADRATRAAMAMQRALRRLNEEWSRQGRPTLSIGIGISVGDVFAGNIGSDRRLEYTVIGDAVNTAARLCSEAGPGEILISGSLHRALANPPRVEALEPLPLKGKAQAVPVYHVEWQEDLQTREETREEIA